MSRLELCLLTLGLGGALGCSSHTLDLDHPAPSTPAPAVTRAGGDPAIVSEDGIDAVWVDDHRLYWLTGFQSFQSCLKSDCAHTILSYAQRPAQKGGIQGVTISNSVYWAVDYSLVFSCPTSGCSSTPTTVTDDPSLSIPIFSHGDDFYWCSDLDLYRCPATGCDDSNLVTVPDVTTLRMIFDATHAYWIDPVGIRSVPLDLSEPPSEQTPPSQNGLEMTSLATAQGYLYWTMDTRIVRSPIVHGGAMEPTEVIRSDAPIGDLAINGSTMFWLEDNAIHACPLLGCERSTQLTPATVGPQNTLNGSTRFAVDADNVYWLQAGEGSTPTSGPTRGTVIRRTPR